VYDRRVVSRLAANRWIRSGVLALVLASCGYGLSLNWAETVAALDRLHWYTMAGSLAAAMTGAWCMMLGWRCVLSDLGSPLSVATTTRINFVAQLGKYVPGGVWAFAAQVELSHDRRVPRSRGTASVLISLVIAIGVGLVVAAVTLPFASPGTAGRYWWLLALVPVILACLCPPVLGPLLDRALRIVRQQPLERRLSWQGLVAAFAWSVVGWLLLGVQVWVLLDGMTGRGAHVLLLALGGYALAFCAGLLLVVFPSGIGAREVIFVAALATTVPHGTAVALALAARLVTTISDLAWGGIGLALGRTARSVPAAHRATGRSAMGRSAAVPARAVPLPSARAPVEVPGSLSGSRSPGGRHALGGRGRHTGPGPGPTSRKPMR
jgi:uncharacterized membrane protein YbhN (UPF0104 family)